MALDAEVQVLRQMVPDRPTSSSSRKYPVTNDGKVIVNTYIHTYIQQSVALTGRNTTGPPCSVTVKL